MDQHSHPVIPRADWDRATERLYALIDAEPDLGFVVAMLIRQALNDRRQGALAMESFLHRSEAARARKQGGR